MSDPRSSSIGSSPGHLPQISSRAGAKLSLCKSVSKSAIGFGGTGIFSKTLLLLQQALSSNVAQYVTVKTFVEALRKLVFEELLPQLLNAGRPLSGTSPFPWSRRTLKADKCIFNLVPCENAFEQDSARFLEKADDVERFTKLPDKFGFTIDYQDGWGNLVLRTRLCCGDR